MSISHLSDEILGADDHSHILYICTIFQQGELRVLAATDLTDIQLLDYNHESLSAKTKKVYFFRETKKVY